MKKTALSVPKHLAEVVSPEEWELEGIEFEIDDKLRGVEKDLLARRANALNVRQFRLLREKGRSIHEDEDALVIASKHYQECRKAVKGIIQEGKPLEPATRVEFLDSVGLLARDEICRAVVEANELGLKNVSGSPS